MKPYKETRKYCNTNWGISVGYISTDWNRIGWYVINLEPWEKEEFPFPRVYRISTGYHTTIVQFSEKYRSIKYFDNQCYVDTGEKRFRDERVPLKLFTVNESIDNFDAILQEQ